MSDGLNRSWARRALPVPLELECGRTLEGVTIAYETYGRADAADGAIVICHALTGSAHVAGLVAGGVRGWWDGLIGPGRAIDTQRYFVVSSNVLGGCYGSTGPTSLDPATGWPYGDAFPTITIRDMVVAQRELLRLLGIERVGAVIGGSMGGMQALEWAAMYPDLVERIIPIATSARQSPWSIGFNAIAREAIALGCAASDEAAGLRLARKVGMMTYRSSLEYDERFARGRSHEAIEPVDGTFDVERYLERHGEKLVARFDAATYATLTRAMDLHDLARGRGELDDVLATIEQPALCVGISTDVRYPTSEQRELARQLPNGVYEQIESVCGHDAFLIELDQLGAIVARFLDEASASSRCVGTTNNSLNEIEA